LVGVRDLDDGERDNLRDSSVDVHPMSAIDRRDLTAVVEDALATAGAAEDGVHVSLDIDWLDPQQAPGVGTPVAGGASYREAHLAMELLAEAQAREDVRIRSVDLVEVDPILDDRNRTAELACELLASLFGKTVY
jgi:arginase